MTWLEGLQNAIRYIEENLERSLDIEEIAMHANISPFHFQRTFAVLTDISIGEYIRRRRLTAAANELIKTNGKVIDVALKYGYDSPEAFSKAFKKQHGATPTETKKGMGKLKVYNPLTIQVSLKGAEAMDFKVTEKKAFQIIGIKRTYSMNSNENLRDIPLFWNEVNSNGTTGFLAERNDGAIKGILGVCATTKETEAENKMDYWVAAASNQEAPIGYDSLLIPASTWAVFEVHGPMPNSIQKVWKQIYEEWFPSSGYQHGGPISFELYSDDNPTNPDYYSEIWIPVKMKK
ncbi:AraC family transcriptional regulator [Niallia sp. 03133]|uniref:AraC family transcriptional regulator n=1 Tax=Niallia sp. 03133 TaxID=3458060 RepID=UPI0040443005